jgi:hypothetical protein
MAVLRHCGFAENLEGTVLLTFSDLSGSCPES